LEEEGRYREGPPARLVKHTEGEREEGRQQKIEGKKKPPSKNCLERSHGWVFRPAGEIIRKL